MEAPPMEVFRALGLIAGFALGYWVLFRPKQKQDD